jgi:hypothetical protein
MGPALAFSPSLVQTLVQTGAGIVASSLLVALAFDDALIVDLGVAGSSPVSHPSTNSCRNRILDCVTASGRF